MIGIGSEGYIGGSLKERAAAATDGKEREGYRIPGRLHYLNKETAQELYDLLADCGYKDRYNR